MKSVKILIVNDKETDLLIIESCLQLSETPFNVLKATNGEQAYELAQLKKPDLIVMDWDMPVLDGISAIKQLKSSVTTSEIPVIMLTAVNRSSDNLKTALSAGAIDFVRYPIDEIEFLARVKSVLRMNQYYREKVQAENEAKKLLKEVGYDENKPFEFTLMTNTGSSRGYAAEILQHQLKKAGVIVHLRVMEWQAFLNTVVLPRNFDGMEFGIKT